MPMTSGRRFPPSSLVAFGFVFARPGAFAVVFIVFPVRSGAFPVVLPLLRLVAVASVIGTNVASVLVAAAPATRLVVPVFLPGSFVTASAGSVPIRV